MIRYISLLLISAFLVATVPLIYAQNSSNNGNVNIKGPIKQTGEIMNATPGNQAGLIENNPGYTKYIPNTPTYSNNVTKPSKSTNISTFTSSLSNISPPTRNGLIENNPEYSKYIPKTQSYSNSNSIQKPYENPTFIDKPYASNVSKTLSNATKVISDTIGKGINGLINIGKNATK